MNVLKPLRSLSEEKYLKSETNSTLSTIKTTVDGLAGTVAELERGASDTSDTVVEFIGSRRR